LQRNAYSLLSDNFIYSLLADNNPQTRKLGWQYVFSIRQKEPCQFPKKIPPINWLANHWTELVSPENLSVELVETKGLSDEAIQKYKDMGDSIDLPRYPSHSSQ